MVKRMVEKLGVGEAGEDEEGGVSGTSRGAATRRAGGYLGDGDGLLLHHLVDGRAVGVGHLVELVDAADALVGEHQGSALQGHLAGHGVLHYGGGQTHAGRAATGGVLAWRAEMHAALRDGRFKCTFLWPSNEITV